MTTYEMLCFIKFMFWLGIVIVEYSILIVRFIAILFACEQSIEKRQDSKESSNEL